jgi:hypothetical protein
MKSPILICSLLYLVPLPYLFAQQAAGYFASPGGEKEWWLDQITGLQNSKIINGKEYFIPFNGGDTHPFYLSRQALPVKVIYDEQVFLNVPVLFDMYSDLVIVAQIKKATQVLVQVDNTKILGFQLNNAVFRRFNIADKNGTDAVTGHYQVLHDSQNILLLAKRRKVRLVNKYTHQLEYKEESAFYTLYHERWHAVKGRKSFYKILPADKTSLIKNFIRKNKLKTRSEEHLTRIVSFIDQQMQQ